MFETLQVVGETQQLMRDIVKQHMETYDEENMRDFVDVYLREMKSSSDVSFTGWVSMSFSYELKCV